MIIHRDIKGTFIPSNHHHCCCHQSLPPITSLCHQRPTRAMNKLCLLTPFNFMHNHQHYFFIEMETYFIHMTIYFTNQTSLSRQFAIYRLNFTNIYCECYTLFSFFSGANILLTEDCSIAKLGDFGLSKRLQVSESSFLYFFQINTIVVLDKPYIEHFQLLAYNKPIHARLRSILEPKVQNQGRFSLIWNSVHPIYLNV